jgi:hypothetical protein
MVTVKNSLNSPSKFKGNRKASTDAKKSVVILLVQWFPAYARSLESRPGGTTPCSVSYLSRRPDILRRHCDKGRCGCTCPWTERDTQNFIIAITAKSSPFRCCRRTKARAKLAGNKKSLQFVGHRGERNHHCHGRHPFPIDTR